MSSGRGMSSWDEDYRVWKGTSIQSLNVFLIWDPWIVTRKWRQLSLFIWHCCQFSVFPFRISLFKMSLNRTKVTTNCSSSRKYSIRYVFLKQLLVHDTLNNAIVTRKKWLDRQPVLISAWLTEGDLARQLVLSLKQRKHKCQGTRGFSIMKKLCM